MKNEKIGNVYRIGAYLLALAMVFGAVFCVSSTKSYALSGVKIGQATSGEGGKLSGCKTGDQSGNEVSISNWSYSKKSGSPYHWNYVFRAKDPHVAKALADAMKKTCANNHIGYDQKAPDRFSFYDEAKAVDWKIDEITTDCETTCASAISVCLNSVGITTDRYWDSSLVYNDLSKTDEFYCYTSSDYTASSAKLLPGDILVNPDRHTAMVVESPNLFQFEVVYKDTATKKEETSYFDEGTELQLFLNNGKDVKTVVVDDSVNLSKYEPEKGRFEFVGWKKNDDGVFTAEFRGDGSIKTTNKIIKIEDSQS